jgi:hypothetical protein
MASGYLCPVCDYPKLSEPPRSEFGGGSFEICPSCGFQFGVNDDDEGISYETWRRRWEAAGMPWSSVALKQPAFWKPVAKHVAPGGAALRRPGEATPATPPASAPVEVPTPAPAAAKAPREAKAPVIKAGAAAKPARQSAKPSRAAKAAKVAKKSSAAKKSARR